MKKLNCFLTTALAALLLFVTSCDSQKPGEGVIGDWVTMNDSDYYNILFTPTYSYAIRTGADDVIENGSYTVNTTNGTVTLFPDLDNATSRTWHYSYADRDKLAVMGRMLNSDTQEKILSLIRQASYEVKTVTVHSTATKSELTPQMLMGASRIKLKGEINQADFVVLRNFEPMTELDMSDVTIIGEIVILTDANGDPVIVDGNAIPESAFGDDPLGESNANTTLKKIILPKNLKIIGFNAFASCRIGSVLNIPSTVELIMKEAFSNCANITGLTFSSNQTRMDPCAFQFCTGLKGTVTLPTELDGVSAGLFRGCINLEKVVLPNEMTIIGEDAFLGCAKMKSINIPTSLEQVLSYAFTNCASLTGDLTLPAEMKSIQDYAFAGTGYKGVLTIPESVEAVGKSAFSDNEFSSIVLRWTSTTTNLSGVDYATWFPAAYAYGGPKKIIIPIGSTAWYIANFPHKTLNNECYYNIEEQ